MAAVLKGARTGPFHAQIGRLGPLLYGYLYGTAPDLTALVGQPRTSPSMPNHNERLLPAPISRPTTPRAPVKPTLVAAPAAATPAGSPTAADALEVLRRLRPLTDVLDAFGATTADYDSWVALGLDWQVYVHPAGHALVDPAAVLAALTSEAAA